MYTYVLSYWCVSFLPKGDIYTNCTCASITGDGGYNPVIEGKCDNGCTYFAATIILLLLFLASAFMGEVPGLVVILRYVDHRPMYVCGCISHAKIPRSPQAQLPSRRTVADEQRALSLGIQSVMFRVIGSIPGPLIFGAIFDSTCILWKYECSEQGNCWEYSNSNLTLRLFLIGLLTNVANTVFMFLGWIWYGRNWCFQKVDNAGTETDHQEPTNIQKPHDIPYEEDSDRNQSVETNGSTSVFPKLDHETELENGGSQTAL